MKNLANCTGVEFLRQTNKIRHAVSAWLKDTKVLEIRKNRPVLEIVTDNMSDDEKKAVKERNEKLLLEQSRKNISDMLDACLETHAEETLKVLAMMCFIEPEDADKVKATELLGNFADMLADEDILRFFTSLTKLDVMTTSN